MKRAVRSLVALLYVAAAICFGAAALGAQSSRAPDCNLGERRFESFLSTGTKGGFVARRWQLQAMRIGVTVPTDILAHVVFRTRAVPSAAIGQVFVGEAPHALQVAEGRTVDPRDAVADAFFASIPLIAAIGWSARGWQSKVLAATTILGGYFAAACWASP